MVRLYNKKTCQYLGRIADEDLQFLIEHLEEESLTDTCYYLSRATLDLLKKKGRNEDFALMIQKALGGNKDIEIRYERA